MLGNQMLKGFALVAGGLLIEGCDQAPLGPASAPVEVRAARADVGGSANAVITWNANAGEAALAACISWDDDPLHESRLYAVMHVAIHDALNAIDRRSRPYALDARIQGPVEPAAAVAAAARDVLVTLIGQIPDLFPPACIQAGIASAEDDYAAALAGIPDGVAKTEGLRLGRAAAAAILALRAQDGSDTPFLDTEYPQGTAPGEYRFTPGFSFVAAPGWADVTPFVLRKSSQFRPDPPYKVTSRKYAADFNEIKALGGDGVTTPSARTAEQTEIALFWVESSPLQWNRIARTVAMDRGLDLWESARLFGLLNMAQADGYVASFDTKYHYNYWRPVTAIRLADTDGNPSTDADPTWTPLVPTPPIPDYESAHLSREVRRHMSSVDSSGRTRSPSPPAACRSRRAAGAATRRPCSAPSSASLRRRPRTASRASWSASTSGRRLRRESCAAAGSAIRPFTTSSGPWAARSRCRDDDSARGRETAGANRIGFARLPGAQRARRVDPCCAPGRQIRSGFGSFARHVRPRVLVASAFWSSHPSGKDPDSVSGARAPGPPPAPRASPPVRVPCAAERPSGCALGGPCNRAA